MTGNKPYTKTPMLILFVILLSMIAINAVHAAPPSGTVTNPITFSGTETWASNLTFSGAGRLTVSGNLTLSGNTVSFSATPTGTTPVITVRSGTTLTFQNNSRLDLGRLGNLTVIKVESGGTLIFDKATVSGANGSNAEAYILADGGTIRFRNGAALSGNTNNNENGNIIRITNGTLSIENSTFSGNTASTGLNAAVKGIISIQGGSVTITGSTFTRNSNNYSGLFYAEDTDTFTVSGSHFTENQAERPGQEDFSGNGGGGIALYARRGTLTIGDNNVFMNNTSRDPSVDNTVIYASKTKVGIGSKNRFENNTGVLFALESSLTVGDENRFVGNHGSTGSVFCTPYSKIDIGRGNLFENNEATQRAGAIYIEAANLAIGPENIFRGNKSEGDGGAICANTGAFSIEDGTVFEQNISGGRGGAIENAHGKFEIRKAVFRENESAFDGGAIYYYGENYGDQEVLSVENTSFIDNLSGETGGAVSLTDIKKIEIRNSSFINNTASKGGSAIYSLKRGHQSQVYEINAEIGENCVFSGHDNNTAIHFSDANVKIEGENIQFTDNPGGAIDIENCNLTIGDGVLFRNNQEGQGGALRAWGGCEITIGKAVFSENIGGLGGAIFQNNGTLTINGTEFRNNRSGNGGAIYAFTDEKGSPERMIINITDGIFIGNFAGNLCGAIQVGSFSGGTVRNSHILNIHSAVFRDNVSLYEGSALCIDSYTTARISDMALINNLGLGIRSSTTSLTHIYPRHGAAIFDNTSGSAPDGYSDILGSIWTNPDTRITYAADIDVSEKMLNGGYHHWRVDESEQYYGTAPSNKDISQAKVIFENNKYNSEFGEEESSSVINNEGNLYIGEPSVGFSAEVQWKYPAHYSEEPPSPADYIPELIIGRSVGEFDTGRIYQESHTPGEDGSDLYIFRCEGDLYTEIRVTDRHDGIYHLEIIDLPKSDDFTLSVNAIPKYDTTVSGSMAEGFTIVNTFREDAIPTATPAPTQTPTAMPTAVPTATPEAQGMDFFRLLESAGQLPQTGISE